jgi:hypothetical protein
MITPSIADRDLAARFDRMPGLLRSALANALARSRTAGVPPASFRRMRPKRPRSQILPRRTPFVSAFDAMIPEIRAALEETAREAFAR